MKLYAKPQIHKEVLIADSNISSSGNDGVCCTYFVVETVDEYGFGRRWNKPGTDDYYECDGFGGEVLCL